MNGAVNRHAVRWSPSPGNPIKGQGPVKAECNGEASNNGLELLSMLKGRIYSKAKREHASRHRLLRGLAYLGSYTKWMVL